jgi:hypothetical protein
VAAPPVAAAAATIRGNQQSTMTQHYGRARSQKPLLPSGWIELTNAVSNRQCYFNQLGNRMVFSKAAMFLKSLPVTPLPSPRMRVSLKATVCSLAREPDQQEPDQAVSAFFPPTIMEATHGTLEEPIKLTSSSSSLSVSGELTNSQTQKI